MNRYLLMLAMLILPMTAAAASSLKVIAMDGAVPMADVRVQVDNLRIRTSPAGEAIFDLKPGKYEVEGPQGKTTAWVFGDAQTLAVLQSHDLKLIPDKVNLGAFSYEGGNFEVAVNYETPLGMPLELQCSGLPSTWACSIEPKILKPDSKAKLIIAVPEGSKEGCYGIQIVGVSGGRIVAATNPLRLSRGWKNKPQTLGTEPETVLPISYNIQTTRKYDRNGTMLDTDLDLIINSNLTPQLSGLAQVRFTHEWNPKDTADSIDVRLANLTYMTGIVNLTAGRLDLASIVQSGEYFGSYLTLGQRRFDGIFAFLPFTLLGTAGVDAEGFKLPPAALSTAYFPNFFSFYPDAKQYDNGFFFAELKLPVLIFDNPLMVSANYAFATNYGYFKYSPLSGDPALSLNVDYTYSQNYKVYSEFAVGNINAIPDTTALMVGAKAKSLNSFTLGLIDEVAVEYQIPLISSANNPFVGGNLWHPDKAQTQKGAWYARAANHFGGLIFTLAATNSVGDFTLFRPSEDAFEPRRVFVLNDKRSANEVADLGKTLFSPSYDTISFLFTVGARF